MESHEFLINKTVRYYSIGQLDKSTKNVWICLHGYGQLAVWFARNFTALESTERAFIVPEGPHRFYLQGTAGRVGASWMTKEDRLNEIIDQFSYLESLVYKLRQSVPTSCNIHVLGFSQGVATALRWLDKTSLSVKSLICWAGSFPPDIDYKLQQKQFAEIDFHACFGDEDEFISIDKANLLIKQLTDQHIVLKPHFYRGGHRLQPDLFREILQSCES